MPTNAQISAFVRESNKIERILREPYPHELETTWWFLCLEEVGVYHLCAAAQNFQPGARLRDEPDMDVVVGRHRPPPGGLHVKVSLHYLLEVACNPLDVPESMRDAVGDPATPYHVHRAFEDLHPFMDANGRTGRLLWAWMMERDGRDLGWWDRGFLHSWYYQSLEHGRQR